MFNRIFVRASLVVVAGAVVVFLFTLATVNLDDVRLKYGDLLNTHEPDVRVGRLYALRDDGHVKPGPPVCSNAQVSDTFFVPKEVRVHVTNVLGANLPLISRFASLLIGDPIGATAEVKSIDGHTLTIDPASQQTLVDDAAIYEYLASLYAVNHRCERAVARLWQAGQCVVVVHRTTHADEDLIGYSYNTRCLVPNLGSDPALYENGPMEAPSPDRDVSETISIAKDFFGLTHREAGISAPEPDPARVDTALTL